ncbi:hypothetical protein HanRHA438_Chr11g0498041 [Helianthus annuus]|nr:hypothetical protein HanRHA438_Chr11g0498041 [Helianthus annuus]
MRGHFNVLSWIAEIKKKKEIEGFYLLSFAFYVFMLHSGYLFLTQVNTQHVTDELFNSMGVLWKWHGLQK